jgi:predicted LPLAT superfamily acyltransferase
MVGWVSGPIQIAMLSRCCLIPFFTYEKNAKMHCDFGQVRDYRMIGKKVGALVQKEMQVLTNLAELYIRDYPCQWQNWWLFNEMIAVKQGGEHADEAEAISP